MGFPVKRTLQAGVVLLLGAILSGCGIKGPPVPPLAPPVPAVTDLAFRVAGPSVTLTWALSDPLPEKMAKGAAFGVYQSRTALGEPACDGCPQVFEKIAVVPFVPTDTNRFSIDVAPDPGYGYLFKVRLTTAGQAGPDSRPVKFDFPSGGPFLQSETP